MGNPRKKLRKTRSRKRTLRNNYKNKLSKVGKSKKKIKNKSATSKLNKHGKKSYHSLNRKERVTDLSLQLQGNLKFFSYEEIKDFLNNLSKKYSSNLQLEVIGESIERRPIYLAIIAENYNESPKNAIFIEAGSDGEDWMAVASALYIIEYLAKNASCSKSLEIMDYFVVPCSNPDAYHNAKLGEKPCINLSTNFPFRLGKLNIDNIGMDKFLKAAKVWKENFEFKSPERLALLKTVTTYQFAIKLFVSLQEEGQKIVYPYGVSGDQILDVEDIRKVAIAGRSGSCLCFQIGSIYQLFGLTFGTIIDFLKMFQNSIRFPYIIHMNNKKCPRDPKDIPERAKELMCCMKLMSKQVCEFYKEYPVKDGDSNVNVSPKKTEIQ